MKKFWKKKEPAVTPDSSDDGELLAYLDGELTPERQAEIRQLLARDWRLRVRLAELERDIETYVKATHPQRQSEPPPFEEVWRGVARRLTEPLDPLPVEAELRLLKRSGLFAGFPNWRNWATAFSQRPVLLRWTGAAVGLMVVAGLTFWLLSAERLRAVSAEELLERATQSETAQINQVAAPVVYRQIQVKRTGKAEAVAWESWRGAGKNQFRQRIADGQGGRFLRPNEQALPTLMAEITAIFQANQLDLQRPLSAAAFAEWRKTITSKAESVTETAWSGNKVPGNKLKDSLKLTTRVKGPVAVNTIIEASLVVRKSDWHAVTLQLNVQGEHETRAYELNETAYEVLPLQALTVFADLAPLPVPSALPTTSPAALPARPALPTRDTALAAPSPATSPLPTEAALKESEVAALYALHQLKADLGEPLEIIRAAGQVIVRGQVETTERKRELSTALKTIPFVAAQIQTFDEATAQTRPAQSPPVTVAATNSGGVTVATPGVNQLERRLARYFAERNTTAPNNTGATTEAVARQMAQLSNDVFAESSAALTAAWALRRLAERFNEGADEPGSAEAARRLREIIGNHLVEIRSRQRKLRALLAPPLIFIVREQATTVPAAEVSGETRKARVMQLFRTVEQLQQLTWRWFDAGPSFAASPEQAARQTLQALAQLDATLLALEQEVRK